MNADSHRRSLDWISLDLDDAIDQARRAFEAYLNTLEKSADSTKLVSALEHTQRCELILDNVQLRGASLLANELCSLLSSLSSGLIEGNSDAYQAIIGGLSQLPTYLSRLRTAKCDTVVAVLPLVNDLRTVRGERLCLDGVVYSSTAAASCVDAESLQQQCRAVDDSVWPEFIQQCQLALDGLQGEPQFRHTALQNLLAQFQKLGYSDNTTANPILALGEGAALLITAAMNGGNRLPLASRFVITDFVAWLAQHAKGGVDNLNAGVPCDLQQLALEMAFCVSVDCQGSMHPDACTHFYSALGVSREDDYIDCDVLRMGEPDIETMDVVVASLIADLDILIKAFEQCAEQPSRMNEFGDLAAMAVNLQYTMQIVQFFSLADTMIAVVSGLEKMQQGSIVSDEEIELLAAKLYTNERELRKLQFGSDREPSELAVLEESRQTIACIRKEIEECLESNYATLNDGGEQLEKTLAPVVQQLESVAGAARMLAMQELQSALQISGEYFTNTILGSLATAKASALPTVFSQFLTALACIESYLQATKYSRNDIVENSLSDAIDTLRPAVGCADNAEHDAAVESTALESTTFDGDSSVEADDSAARDEEHSAVAAADDTAFVALPLDADIDDEIADIFLEEAEEVLEALGERYPQWLESQSLGSDFDELRRGYHTLKGSGRMAGAEHVGDTAWAIENLLNRIQEETVPLDRQRIELVGEANALMPAMVEAFRQRVIPYPQAMQSMVERAELLASEPNAEIEIGLSLRLLESASTIPADEPPIIDGQVDGVLGFAGTDTGVADVVHVQDVVDVEDLLEDVAAADILAGDQMAASDSVHSLPSRDGSALAASAADNFADGSVLPGSTNSASCDVAPESLSPADHNDLIDSPAPDDSSADVSEDERLFVVFFEEAQIQLATLAAFFERDELSEMDAATALPDDTVVRAFHTLLGGARIAGVEPVARVVESAESLLSSALLDKHVSGAQRDVIAAAIRWVKRYLGGDLPSSSETDTLFAELERVADEDNSGRALEAPAVPDSLQMPDGADPIFDAIALLRQWRVEGARPAQCAATEIALEELSVQHVNCSGIQPLANALLSGYQFFGDGSLHLLAHRAMIDAHRELEDMLDRKACGQPLKETDKGEALKSLVDSERALAASIAARPSPTSIDSTSLAVQSLDAEIVGIFLEESEDLIEEVEAGVEKWLKNRSDLSYLDSLLRPLHTIKGGARMAGLQDIGNTSHEFEALLQSATQGDAKVNASFFKKVSAFVAELTDGISAIDLQVNSEAPTASTDPEQPATEEQREEEKRAAEMVRVSSGLLEQLVNLAGETSISRSLIEEQVSDFTYAIEEVDSTVERLKEQLRRLEIETEAQINFRREQVEIEGLDEFDPLEMDRYSQLQQLSKSLVESASDLKDLKSTLKDKTRDIETLLLQQARINTELQEGLMHTRTVPVSRSIVPRLRRTVRQVSGELDKPVTFDIGRAEGELDRSIIERMVAPLEHVLRNAIDHGIESVVQRAERGKPESGAIRLEIHREGGDVVLSLSDDGRGIDVEAVRKKALTLGLMDESSNLTDEDIIQFIFTPGFTTAEKVTQISGRGVGMAAVQSDIRELGGTVSVATEAQRGSTFIFRLPFTVSMNRALLVSAGGETLAIPLDTIEGIVRVSPYELEEYYGDDAADFLYAGQQYDFRYLGSLINGSQFQHNSDMTAALPVLLARGGDRLVALQVDRLMGSREIVVKGLGPQFSKLQGISGATVLGDGSVVMIADLAALVRHREILQGGDEPDVAGKSRDTLLAMVVDDSVTVRKVTTRLLERNGFDVLTAKDGIDAMEKLEDIEPDIVLLDIEMPRLDGFEVVSRMRHDPRLANVPVVMISSRTGDKHRERAIVLGANEFLGKPYQEKVLLGTIDELLQAVPSNALASN